MSLPYPVPDELTQEFWNGVNAGELRLQACNHCDRLIHLPEPACPFCGAEGLAYRPLSGRGELYSWTRTVDPPDPAFAPLVPFVIAVVALEEQSDILISAPLLGASEGQRPVIGSPVQIGFSELLAEGPVVPVARLTSPQPTASDFLEENEND